MTQAGLTTLSYAQPPRWHRRRRFRRIVIALLAIAIVTTAVRWGPQSVRQARLLYWQRACMNYRAPADQVVYENGPKAAALLATSREYLPLSISTTQPVPVGHQPACLARFEKVSGATTRGGGVLFMHEMHLPSRPNYLVIVRSNFAWNASPTYIPGYDLDLSVQDPATWKSPPRNVMAAMAIRVLTAIPLQPPQVRIFAGQPDPADASHFTIRYELDGKRYIADGRLEELSNGPGRGTMSAFVRFTTRPENQPEQR